MNEVNDVERVGALSNGENAKHQLEEQVSDVVDAMAQVSGEVKAVLGLLERVEKAGPREWADRLTELGAALGRASTLANEVAEDVREPFLASNKRRRASEVQAYTRHLAGVVDMLSRASDKELSEIVAKFACWTVYSDPVAVFAASERLTAVAMSLRETAKGQEGEEHRH